jgi:Sec-independent protein translocase protein TatA
MTPRGSEAVNHDVTDEEQELRALLNRIMTAPLKPISEQLSKLDGLPSKLGEIHKSMLQGMGGVQGAVAEAAQKLQGRIDSVEEDGKDQATRDQAQTQGQLARVACENGSHLHFYAR